MAVTYQQLLDHIHANDGTNVDGIIDALGIDSSKRSALVSLLQQLGARGVIILSTEQGELLCFRMASDRAKADRYADAAGFDRAALLPI